MIKFYEYPLSKEIQQALKALQYEKATTVQREVIPVALSGKDVVVQSQTGSGKTAAFAIPLCEKVHWLENKPQAIVLTPTRELAVQIQKDIMNIGKFKRIKATAIFGKASFEKQKMLLKQKTHVVVGTPGRVLDHIKKGTLCLQLVKHLIIDEADEMLSMGFIDQVEAIIEQIPSKRQTMMFSATIPPVIEQLTVQYMKEPILIKVQAKEAMNKIDHYIIHVEDEEKQQFLNAVTIVENPSSCIIFCRTQKQVDLLIDFLNTFNYPCDKIHGNMYQEDRFEVMNDFKRGKFLYLVATDVAARGIHIENVQLVINYDMPQNVEGYVHRTGRTGRAGKRGKAISFVTARETDLVDEIEEHLHSSLQVMKIPTKSEINSRRNAFTDKIAKKPTLIEDSSKLLHQDVIKLSFNGGKKKKLRAVDFVGTIAKIPGVTSKDIGIINIFERTTEVEILNGKGNIVKCALQTTPIKGKQLKIRTLTN